MRFVLLYSTALIAALSGGATSAAAYTIWNGATDSNWFTTSNWTAGSPNGGTDAYIIFTGTVGTTPTIAAAGAAALSLSLDAGNKLLVAGSGSTLVIKDLLSIGFLFNDQATSSVTVSNGGGVTVGRVFIGDGFVPGLVAVSGIGSTLTANGDGAGGYRFLVGGFGTGTLQIDGGGTVNAGASGNQTLEIGLAGHANGTLQLGVGGASGTLNAAQITFGTAGSKIVANNTDTATLAAAISGDGSVSKSGSGTLVLTGINTYTGGTIINAGTLQLGNGGASGSILGNVLDNGIFAVKRSDAFTFGTRILGSGAFRQLGAGVTILTGISTYTGGTNIIAGTLQLGNGGTLGSITGDVVNNGIFAINHANAFTFGGVISGSGAFTQLGTGVTTLAALESYTGLTTITAGTLALTGAGNIASSSGVMASGAFNITGVSGLGTSVQSLSGGGSVALGDKTLTLTNAFGDFAGVIGGTGGFALAAGKETLSGLNTYTGVTNVNGGALNVNGSIASSSLTTVNAGGTLGGNGTVGNTTVNGGTLAPGNSIGTLAVQGNLVFTAAASYMVEVSPANADRTNVAGTATLGGATVKASFAAGTYVARQYTILNATGGVSGTFNTLANTDLPANFKSSLSYDSNNAYLNLALNFIPPPGSGLNANQQSAANAIVGFFNANAGIPLVFGGLTPVGLTQISGEVATGTQQTTFNAMNQFMGVLSDPFIAGRGDPVTSSSTAPQFVDEADAASAYASNGKPRKSERDAYAAVYRKAPALADPFTQRWSVWAAGYGGSQTTDGNTALGSNNTRSSIGGVAVGADYRFSPYTIAGFALAGGATNFSVNGLGSGRSDLFQAGAFVRHNVGAAYLTGALAYGWQDITTDRTVTVAGTDLLRAQFNANAFSGRVEGGYRFVTPSLGGIGITPYAAGQFVTFDLPAYAEQAIAGANTFALSYASKSVTDTRSELGLRTDKSFAMQNGIFTLRGRAAWAHDFNPDRNIAATFQTLPGASFVVNGAAQAPDAALVTGSAEMKWLNGFALAAAFEGEFSNVTRSYAGKVVARYTW
jgi:autotransporter-associated beta strand protein